MFLEKIKTALKGFRCHVPSFSIDRITTILKCLFFTPREM